MIKNTNESINTYLFKLFKDALNSMKLKNKHNSLARHVNVPTHAPIDCTVGEMKSAVIVGSRGCDILASDDSRTTSHAIPQSANPCDIIHVLTK